MDYTFPLLFLILGLAVGGTLTWFILRVKFQQANGQAKADAIRQTKAEIEAERATLTERLRGSEAQILRMESALRDKESQTMGLRAANLNLNSRLSELETKLQEERKRAEEKLALLDGAQQKLLDVFKALSADALNSNNQSFLLLANATLEKFNENAKGDLEKRQQAITELVKPVQDSLAKFDSRVQELEKARIGAYESLGEQVRSLLRTQEQLRSETSNLVKALGRPTVRGRWGEIQLKRVVELAGMLDHCDFYEQESVNTEDSWLRPDMLVRLPGQKTIVVDAKAPLEAYLEANETEDGNIRKTKLSNHARQIRSHITALGKKSYWNQFQPSPEFVVLFLPGEVFFSAALEHDPSLIEIGVEEHVILATPTTLIALLCAVAFGWRQEKIAQNAQDIAELGRELYKRIADMSEHWRKLGKSLGSAVDSYNKATGSLESRVLVSARKFKDLETTAIGDEIEELPPVDRVPRELQIAEMVAP